MLNINITSKTRLNLQGTDITVSVCKVAFIGARLSDYENLCLPQTFFLRRVNWRTTMTIRPKVFYGQGNFQYHSRTTEIRVILYENLTGIVDGECVVNVQ